MTVSINDCGNWTTLNFECNTSSNDWCHSLFKSTILAQSPLGSGSISKLAQKADDLDLSPKCYVDDKTAYLSISSVNKKKADELHKYALELGFKNGEVNIKGKTCPCYL